VKSIGRLHVITDVTVQSRYSHEELAEMACAGGADVVQLRDKLLARDALADTARRVAAVCRRHGVSFVVNDHADVARDVEADGVHVGRTDLSIREARALLGPHAIIGASTGNLEEALGAQDEGADYVGVGHVFATASKIKSAEPIGLGDLARVSARVFIPVIAIGGITEANAASVMATGAWGIAVIGAVCAADHPRAATERLRRIVERKGA
jgi:thiamine-phosphate pyrophosphorylase